MNLRKVSLLLLAVVLCVCFVLPAAAATEERTAVVSIELAGERNVPGDTAPIAGGWAGTAVTVGTKSITVTDIGRMWFTGSSTTHCYMVVNTDGSLHMDYLRVDSDPAALVDGEYAWTHLATPLVLEAGKTYYFVSDFWGAEDKFYDSSIVTPSEDVSFIGTVALNAANAWDLTEAANVNMFPLNFKYTVEVPDAPPVDDPPKTGDLPLAAIALALIGSGAALAFVCRKKER